MRNRRANHDKMDGSPLARAEKLSPFSKAWDVLLAVLLALTGMVAARFGLPAVMMFVAAWLAAGALTFFVYTRPSQR